MSDWKREKELRDLHWDLSLLYQGRSTDRRAVDSIWRRIEWLEAELGAEK